MIGQTVSHYRILEKIGQGGMGEIYLAEDSKLERKVALKFLPRHLTADKEARERFEREAKATAALNHPNIITVYEIGEHEGQVFIAMEYVDGQTLKELITVNRTPSTVDQSPIAPHPLPLAQVLEIATQIAEGLSVAHAKGIVHRDIKPQNILVDRDNHVKILDFGLAKLKGISSLTKESSTLGTVHYMSPEQAMGKDVDQRSDIWSMGVVLYEMLAGRLPFQGEYEQAVIYSILNEPSPKLRSLRPEVPPELEKIVDRCLEKDRDKRYQRAGEIIADLRSVQQVILKTVNVSGHKPKRAWWIGIGAVLLSTVILLYFFLPRKEAAVGDKSIAVLPFVDMSPQKDQEYFCDGMAEELINRLSNIQALRVPARTSTFFFKGKTADIREVGSKLNVQTVLEGSVQKAGERLRITAQLINVADGYHLWSEKYDRTLEDVFSIQDEISSAIVEALRLKLTVQEKIKMEVHQISNAKAYDYYLRANYNIWRFKEEFLGQAIRDLQSAIDITGPNPLLYSAMGDAYRQYVNIGTKQEDYIARAEDYVRRALALDPDSPAANTTLASLYYYRDLREGIPYLIKALAVNPNETGALLKLIFSYYRSQCPFAPRPDAPALRLGLAGR